MPDLVPVRRALVSVSDKTGLVPFIQALAARGVEIISTGGTATALRQAGIRVTAIDEVTGFPEIMGGRVKTLHPKVHGGLLGVRDDPAHHAQMEQHGIRPIDLVCVNLYPFEQTVLRPGCTEHDAIENIDIGGPSMIRSASKNFEWVTVVVHPRDYDRVLHDIDATGGATTRPLRAELASEAFALTSRYDAAITSYLKKQSSVEFPPLLNLSFVKADELRYGENPHQPAALYRMLSRGPSSDSPRPVGTIASAEQLHGKDLSYNNILDASAALELAWALGRVAPDRTGAVVVKHTNPCGAALASSGADAVREAIASDPVAAYGGILALNRDLDGAAAERLIDKSIFLEVVIAPRFDAAAIDLLRAKSANLRLLASGDLPPAAGRLADHTVEFRSIPGGMLAQERDTKATSRGEFVHRAGPAPSEADVEIAAMLEVAGRALLSNAIIIGGRSPTTPGAIRMFGAGAGQMDRMTACRIAAEKAGANAAGAVAYSDAFFPFADGPAVLIDAGVRTIVHPGGSKRDDDTFKLCTARGVTCLTTGTRHFRH